MRIAFVNQDRGIAPGRKKGAAVHLRAMRSAFEGLGATVVPIDESDDELVRARLSDASSDGIDVVYERYALGCSTAAAFAEAQGIPHVLEVNAPLAEEQALYRGAPPSDEALARERFAFRAATSVFAVSSAVADYVRASAGDRVAVEVHPNGVDTQRFRPRTDEALRRELGLAGRLVLGFHGRLRPWHGIALLVEAAERLLARGVPVHLLLIGEGDYRAAVDGRIADERVTLRPWVDHDEIGRFVAAMDVLPLTYAPDRPCYFSPLKLAEGMACGVVPVVPAMGDLTGVVRHEHDGLVYDAGDVAQLVAGVERLHAEPDLAARLSRAATESAARHSWTRIAASVLEKARAKEAS